jgi:uncharacterized membrane protein YdjX (TVP38/TMEM64 family)
MSDAAAGEPRGQSERGRLRLALLRFMALALIVAALAALLLLTPASQYLEREALAQLLGQLRQAWWAPLALIACYLVIAPSGIPITPLIFAGGAVFGPLWGWLYNSLGSLLGGVISFGLAHALGKELVEHLAGERRMQKVEAMLERHGFWTLVGIRFMPIPFAFVNYGAALTGLRFGPFLLSTVIGLVPSVLMWTYLYYALVSAATEDRGALVRNFGLIIGMIALLMVLRPLGRALLRRDQASTADPDIREP